MLRRKIIKNRILVLAACVARNNLVLLNRKKRLWTKSYNAEKQRELHGFYTKIFKVIKEENDEKEMRKFTRMGIGQFNLLLNLLKSCLTKTSPRKPIAAECRLVMTLMFLSQGANFVTIGWMFRVGGSTARKIILETCDIIWHELRGIYLAPPNKDEWRRIATDFYTISGLPHCVGAIDGKHIRIKCPPNAGSVYFNYKKYHSVVLLAACDSNYCFTAVDIGAYGGQSDGGVFKESSFGKAILEKTIEMPEDENMPKSNVKVPYFFVGDAAFPLKSNIMRPFSGSSLSESEDIFNKTLSKARVKIENAFGIMTMRWRVLLNVINCFPENAEKICKAVVVLHNFVKMNDGEYCPPEYVDSFCGDTRVEGLWRKEVRSLETCRLFTRFNAPKTAFAIRNTLKEYIVESRNLRRSS